MTRSRARQLTEAWLRGERWSFVDVREAHRSLERCASTKRCAKDFSDLTPFDYVAYPPAGGNLLILLCRRITPARRWQMEEWERIFGPEFRAVFVEPHECSKPTVRSVQYSVPPDIGPEPIVAAPSRQVQLALFGGGE